MARKPTPQKNTASVDDELVMIEEMLQEKYALRKKGSPQLRWDKIKGEIKHARKILDNALAARVIRHEQWLEANPDPDTEEPIDHIATWFRSIKHCIDPVWDILTNKDGNADIEKEITNLITLKKNVEKRNAEAYKLSGQVVSRKEYMREIETILRIMNKEIDAATNDRDLAADIKNAISKGLARRRVGQIGTRAPHEEVEATEPDPVRRSDSPVQDVGVAEDTVQGAVTAVN